LYHPYFNDTLIDYNVAIVFLPEPITDVQSVQLNEDKNVPKEDEELDVAGWGLWELGWDRISLNGPKAVTLNYVTNEMCTQEPYKWHDMYITDRTMCAIGDEEESIYFGDFGKKFVHWLLLNRAVATKFFV
jgi:hypothetical protein